MLMMNARIYSHPRAVFGLRMIIMCSKIFSMGDNALFSESNWKDHFLVQVGHNRSKIHPQSSIKVSTVRLELGGSRYHDTFGFAAWSLSFVYHSDQKIVNVPTDTPNWNSSNQRWAQNLIRNIYLNYLQSPSGRMCQKRHVFEYGRDLLMKF